MSRDVMQSILQKIKEYDRILLFRHTRCDGDCVGATKGLARILKLTYPEKEIRILQCRCNPLSCSDNVIDPDLSIRVTVHVCKALVVDLESCYRTREHCPHLWIKIREMSYILAVSDLHS